MSGEFRRTEAPHDPPWSLDGLADFHADVVDEAQHAEWRTLLARDPAAREAVDAFDATLRDLHALRDAGDPPPEPMPVEVGARIEDALRVEAAARAESGPASSASGGAAVVSLDAARRRRRMRWGTGLLAAAAAVTGIAVVAPALMERGQPQAGDTAPTTEAGRQPNPGSSGPTPLALQGSEVELVPAQLTDLLGSHQLGALSEPEKLIGCLRANGVESGKPLGSRSITLNGAPAQLLILPNGNIGEFRLLAVGPECGPDNPATLSDTVFGN